MKAYSPDTHTEYDTIDDLIAAECYGYTVVIMLRSTNAKPGSHLEFFARTVGVFPTKDEAKKEAARQRYRFGQSTKRDGYRVILLGVSVEPIWKQLLQK